MGEGLHASASDSQVSLGQASLIVGTGSHREEGSRRVRSGRSIKRGAVPTRAVATHTCHHAVMSLLIPNRLAEGARRSPEGKAWLDQLPATLQAVRRRWSLTVEQPFDGNEVSAAWVAPVRLRDGFPAVLKLGLPHPEAEQEITRVAKALEEEAALIESAAQSLDKQ